MNKKMSWEEQEKRIEEGIQLRDAEAKGRWKTYNEYSAHLQSFRCVVCDEPGGRRRLWCGREVALCNACMNAWYVYITAHPLWLEWVEMEARYDVAVHSCAEEIAIDIKRQAVELQAKGYKLSGRWLASIIVERHGLRGDD